MSLRILGGEFKGRVLRSPKTTATRPTQGILRQAIFNICQNRIDQARFLDLFAGSGAMGLEALSRGAKVAVFVEQDKSAIRCIRENIELLHLNDRSKLIASDYMHALKQLEIIFDLIYIDPPYSKTPQIASQILAELEKKGLLAPQALVFIEDSSQREDLIYESEHLKKKDIRKFGVARLHQFEFIYTARD